MRKKERIQKVENTATKFWKLLTLIVLISLPIQMTYKSTDWDYVAFVQEASKLNTYDLDEYVLFYMKDMENNGFNIDSLMAKQKVAYIRFQDMGRNTIGRADGMFEDDEIKMKISPRWWRKLNSAEKLFVIYHEAGHDFWYKWHGSSWIMSRSKKATGKITYERIWKMREEYFNSIRNGNQRPRLWYGIGVPARPRGGCGDSCSPIYPILLDEVVVTKIR